MRKEGQSEEWQGKEFRGLMCEEEGGEEEIGIGE